jgi:hypothetical protein
MATARNTNLNLGLMTTNVVIGATYVTFCVEMDNKYSVQNIICFHDDSYKHGICEKLYDCILKIQRILYV